MEVINEHETQEKHKIKGERQSHSNSQNQHRRIQGGELIAQGYRNREIVKILGCGLSTVQLWRKTFNEHGLDAFLPKPKSGRRPKLNDKQLEKLKRLLTQGATKFGYANAIWTSRRVKALILKKFGVSYCKVQVCRILRKIGYSPKKPIKRSKKHSQQAVQHWRRYKWPLRIPMSITFQSSTR